MKIRYLLPALSAALLASGCGKKDVPASVADASAATSAAVTPTAASTGTPAATASSPAAAPTAAAAKSADARTIEITANDQMQFNVKTIEAKAGEQLKVVLKNVGSLPKEAMGHNWVLLKADADVTAFATAAMTAKDTDYIPPAMKDKVVASIPVLGPKKDGEVTFTAPAAGTYTYICSFPGHYMLMRGTLTVK